MMPLAKSFTKMKVVKPKVLRTKAQDEKKERAKARGPGANPASRKRNLDYAKCGLVKIWPVDTRCGYDLVSKREVAVMKRFVEKAKHTITFHTANKPTVTEFVANVYVKDLDEHISPYISNSTPSSVDGGL